MDITVTIVQQNEWFDIISYSSIYQKHINQK